MTDPLTDAVRRLKRLQENVERLESRENVETEPRLLFDQLDVATANDSATLQGTSVDDGGFYNSVGYTTSSYNDP
jgi:hypothetical protein